MSHPVPPPAVLLDVHPSHIMASEQAGARRALFCCTLQPDTMPSASVAMLLYSGLRSMGRAVAVREFDAAGREISKHVST